MTEIRAIEIRAARQRGFALVIVLWFLVLLAFIGIEIAASGRTEIYIARNEVAAARAEALAEAGVFQAIYALSDTTPETSWDADGEVHRLGLAGGDIWVSATDESAKIDPNAAPQPIVEGLFLALGLDPEVARAIAGGIAQAAHASAGIAGQSGAGPGTGPSGAGAAGVGVNFAAAAAPPAMAGSPGQAPQDSAPGGQTPQKSAPQGSAFETIEDLLQIAQMTPEILASARPHLTVDSGLPKPTLTHADATVRRALQIAGEKPPPQGAAAAGADATGGMLIADIIATAHSADGAIFIREAVVRIDPASGFTVLRWQRRDAPDS